MASRKFRFVSPGVFLREVDNSQLPGQSNAIGPIIIGRTRKGPALRPYKVKSLDELERVFGKPMPGNQGEDPWRDGTGILAESYAPYAAKAYLTAGRGTDSPVTMVRLLGVAGDDATALPAAEPGWKATQAHGLFLFQSSSNTAVGNDLQLAAVFYSTDSNFKASLNGQHINPNSGSVNSATVAATTGHVPVMFDSAKKLTVKLETTTGTSRSKEVKFAFGDIRKEFNTNPVSTTSRISSPSAGSIADAYWLGETFEETYNKFEKATTGTANTEMAAVILPLDAGMADFKGSKHEATAAKTGWVFGQDTSGDHTAYSPDNLQKLFRIVSLHEGRDSSKEILIGIEDISVPREGATNRFGTFSVVVKRIGTTRVEAIERFDNCNLDPNSPDFVAKKIGDQYMLWSPSEKRNKLYGENPNMSEQIRVDMNQDIISNGGPINTEHVPFGFYGPIVPATISVNTDVTTAAAAATATIACLSASKADYDDTKITLISADGTSRTYAISNGGSGTGTVVSGTIIRVNVGAASSAADVAAEIKTAMEHAHGHTSSKLTVERNGANLTVTQATSGHAGNTTIAALTGSGADAAVLTVNGGITETKFSGGLDSGTDGAQDLQIGLTSWVNATLNLDNHRQDANGEALTVNVKWPESLLINTSSATQDFYQGISPYKFTFDGLAPTGLDNGSKVGSKVNKGYVDYVRRMSDYGTSALVSSQDSGLATAGTTEHSFIFTLDEVVLTPTRLKTNSRYVASAGDVKAAYYQAGSRTGAGVAWTAVDDKNNEKSYAWHIASGSGDYRTLLDVVDGFNMPLVGGFDGVDITEADPFNANVLNNGTTADSYAYASVDRALELIKDPEAVEHNLALMPGITEESLTTKLVDACEARADSMAIIDLPDVYKPPFEEKCDNFQSRIVATPESAAKALTSRQLNSSYGAAYYPWVKIKDEESNRDVWVPPSVVALGVMAHTERNSEVWFAPAGFNRGGLNQGNAGVPVLQVTEQLLSKDRDTLYQANINPIASFVSEGIVIFGQKTLQSSQSALDRINVRRLLIFVKKEVSRISSSLLFEQNVQATWARFHGQVKNFLDSVKVRFGLTDFKVLLDSTTTTPDLIDRNVMYAKIFLKPARAIEFIAVDFVITNTGASFDD